MRSLGITFVMTRQVASGLSIWLGRGARSGKNCCSFCIPALSPSLLVDVEAALPFSVTLVVRPRVSLIDSSEVDSAGDPKDLLMMSCS